MMRLWRPRVPSRGTFEPVCATCPMPAQWWVRLDTGGAQRPACRDCLGRLFEAARFSGRQLQLDPVGST